MENYNTLTLKINAYRQSYAVVKLRLTPTTKTLPDCSVCPSVNKFSLLTMELKYNIFPHMFFHEKGRYSSLNMATYDTERAIQFLSFANENFVNVIKQFVGRWMIAEIQSLYLCGFAFTLCPIPLGLHAFHYNSMLIHSELYCKSMGVFCILQSVHFGNFGWKL